MAKSFKELPKPLQRKLVERLGLPRNEERVLLLRYVKEFDYGRIAAEMNLSRSSIGPLLTKARKHMAASAVECYALADPDVQKIVDLLGWREGA